MTGGIFGLPRWLTGLAALIAIYCAVMLAAALWMPHELDWVVYEWVSVTNPPAFSDSVQIVDVPWDSNDVAANRRHVARFLGSILARHEKPSAVIFDIQFIRCQTKPCGTIMDSARQKLVAAIRAATQRFPVYATEEVSPQRGSDEVTTPREPHDPIIYSALSGAAHTVFPLPFPQARVAFYRRCYADVPYLADDGVTVADVRENIWSMVDRVLIPAKQFLGLPCDASHVAVRLGPKLSGSDHHISPSHFDLSDKYVIVGTVAVDKPAQADRSGPEILGWAFSNALEPSSLVSRANSYATIPQNGVLLLLIPAFSGAAASSSARWSTNSSSGNEPDWERRSTSSATACRRRRTSTASDAGRNSTSASRPGWETAKPVSNPTTLSNSNAFRSRSLIFSARQLI